MKIKLNGVKFTVIRSNYTQRGGGIEIDLSPRFKGEKMAAYQNYLGGGMLGAIEVNDTLRASGRPWLTETDNKVLDAIGEDLKKYFYRVMNASDDDIVGSLEGYEELQTRPTIAY